VQIGQYPDERRSAVRIDFETEVNILDHEGTCVATGQMLNISVAGALVALSVPDGTAGTPVTMQIIFPGRTSRLIIDGLDCVICRVANGKTAFSFQEPLEWSLLFHVYRKRVIENKGGA
jgi:hypothetical protein